MSENKKNGCLGTLILYFFVSIISFVLCFIVYELIWGLVIKPLELKGWFLGQFTLFFMCYLPLILTILFIVFVKRKKTKPKNGGTFGDARYSELSEILGAGLQGEGIVFGGFEGKEITKPPTAEGHCLIVGGTGTGKSRGVVIPTLFSWQGSAIVMDIKGELSNITSDFRRNFNKIYIFDPESENCACYNPIASCQTVDQAQELSRILIPIPNSGDKFWAQSAQAILSSYIYEGAKNNYLLGDIAENLCTTPINELVDHCRNSDVREVRLLASVAYDMPEETLGGVMAELKSKLITIATDDNIRRATARADWSPETLEENATIYLKVPEHLLEQYKELWTIIIGQTMRYLSKRGEKKQPPVLILLDELPRLSEIQNLAVMLPTLRSRNVHFLGIIQSIAQLDLIYGEKVRKVVADNCLYKLVLSATDPETQKYFSDMVGQHTALSKGTSTGSGILPNKSTNESGTAFIRPEVFARLERPLLFAPKIHPTQLYLLFWDLQKKYSNCYNSKKL